MTVCSAADYRDPNDIGEVSVQDYEEVRPRLRGQFPIL